ncbi:hypothetical protein DCC81_16420 [Chitinophaga parva]|uniref:DUF4397 domain-containing protein n=1 Tax=Chitinophaga parva TaxID=2169414 RepID=A0A2T7BHT5_9BACT|nr:DUF4397 domain-containing protein [Chitinophaga parva]PUZ25840.1 hypothetical protein DCC81_16420 [Chitinophaga parva]
MKQLYRVYACLLVTVLAACGKETTPPTDAAALNIMNAIVGSQYVATNFRGAVPYDYYRTLFLQYGDSNLVARHYSCFSGEQPLWIYNYPDTTAKDVPLLKLDLQLSAGSIHSLYLTGTVAHPDTVFTEEHLPYHPLGDSTTSIRFINLSPGSNPVKVVLKGKTTPEAASVPYRSFTGFITYPVHTSDDDYVFEFRDAASDALILTYTATGIHNPAPSPLPHPWLYQNRALALTGIPGGTGLQQQKVLVVKY